MNRSLSLLSLGFTLSLIGSQTCAMNNGNPLRVYSDDDHKAFITQAKKYQAYSTQELQRSPYKKVLLGLSDIAKVPLLCSREIWYGFITNPPLNWPNQCLNGIFGDSPEKNAVPQYKKPDHGVWSTSCLDYLCGGNKNDKKLFLSQAQIWACEQDQKTILSPSEKEKALKAIISNHKNAFDRALTSKEVLTQEQIQQCRNYIGAQCVLKKINQQPSSAIIKELRLHTSFKNQLTSHTSDHSSKNEL